MGKPTKQPPRFVVDVDMVDELEEQDVATQDESSEEYAPVLRTPNFFRKLYGYSVYHKDSKSAF